MTMRNADLPDPLGPVPASGAEPQAIAGRIESYLPALAEGPPPGLASTPDMGSLLRALRRRWLAAFSLGLLLAMMAAVCAYVLLSPASTAIAQIKVLPYDPVMMGQSLDPAPSPVMYMKSQAAYLKSRPVLQGALKNDEVKRLGLDSKHAEPLAFLEKNLTVEATDNSDLLSVKFAGDDPQQAVAVLKGITDAYMDQFGYYEKKSRKTRVDDLEKIYHASNLSIKEKKERLKKAEGPVDKETLSRQREELVSGLRELRSQRVSMGLDLVNAQSQLKGWELKVKTMEKLDLTEPALDAALEGDPQGRLFHAKVERLKTITKDYEDKGLTNEPTYIRAAQLLQTQEELLSKRREGLRDDLKKRTLARANQDHQVAKIELEHKISGLTEQLAKLHKEIEEQNDRLAKLGTATADLELLKQIESEEATAKILNDRLERLKVELNSPDRITILQEAELQAADTKKQLMASIGSPVAVLLLVCMGVAWSDVRKRRIYSAGEVAHGLRMRVVGTIPDTPQLERLLDLNADQTLATSGVIEALDAVRTVVLHDAEANGARIILVGSAGTGEGKTTLASQLAGSLARAGRKTLLIDGDLRRPCLHELLNTPLQPGLSEVLMGEADLDDGLHETNHENLTVMPAGQWDREVLHALARGGLHEMFLRLRQSFDFLILDSHPILEATDALLIGKHVDAALLTVLRQVSRMPQVYLAQQRLQSVGVPVLGVVVNGCDPNEVVLPVTQNQPGQVVAA